jgi:serine phosphatase RsbU (regulator of sigma subunit)
MRLVEDQPGTAHELGEKILNELARFMDGALPSDDVTVVVVRIL